VHHVASKRFEVGGVDLTNLFARELQKSNPSVNLDISDVERIKELYAKCAFDQLEFEKMQNSCPAEQHTLPDGQVVINKKCIVLFNAWCSYLISDLSCLTFNT
jgi:actin-related protein 7, plant